MGPALDQFQKQLKHHKTLLQKQRYGVDIRVPASSLFAKNSTQLIQQDIPVLDDIIAFCRYGNYTIGVEGHAVRAGAVQPDWYLSLMRAVEVSRYLKEKGAIDSDRLYSSSLAAVKKQEYDAAGDKECVIVKFFYTE
jgi:flagellar motor protein MotB